MFSVPFYNGGYTVDDLTDYSVFTSNIELENTPKVLICNLDQWMFNEAWAKTQTSIDRSDFTTFEESPSPSIIKKTWFDILDGKIQLPALLNESDSNMTEYGLNAVINDRGFRKDGSMDYGHQIDKLTYDDASAFDYGFSETLQRVRVGSKRFEYGEDLYATAVDSLIGFLDLCKAKNMKVVAFLPPFPPKVYGAMKDTKKYGYLRKITPVIKPIFEKYGFEFWDFTDPAVINSLDSEFVDGFHGSEVTYAKMLLNMRENNSVIGKYLNSNDLTKRLKNTRNRYVLY